MDGDTGMGLRLLTGLNDCTVSEIVQQPRRGAKKKNSNTRLSLLTLKSYSKRAKDLGKLRFLRR